jgi:uncharacterized protein with HEPN domain
MDIEIKVWLCDILNAIKVIDSFFLDSPKEIKAYQNDLISRKAVERNVEIIGEAMNRILQKQHSYTFQFKKNCSYRKSNYSWI